MTIPTLTDELATCKCIKCGVDITPTAKFCPGCGASQAKAAPASIKCAACGFELPKEAAFCSECGVTQTSTPLDAVAPPMASEERFNKPEVIALSPDDESLQHSPSPGSTTEETKPTSGRMRLPLLILGGLVAVVILIMIVRIAGRSPQQQDKDWVAANLKDALTPNAMMKQSGLTANVLENMVYHYRYRNYREDVTIANGKATVNREDYWIVNSSITFGDLGGAGKDDAVEVIAENGGGSGTDEYLVVVSNIDGKAVDTQWIELDGSVQTIAIDNQSVHVNTLIVGPNDAMCCPTQHGSIWFRRKKGKFVEAS